MEKAKGLAALRIVLGAGFLYAGLEKVFDFAGSGKPFTAAGFLQFGTAGTLPGSAEDAIVNPTHDFWVSVATNAGHRRHDQHPRGVGEVAIGIALILGFATRFAGVMGAILMGAITIAAWNFGFGPINETVLYAAVALYLAYAEAGLAYGVDAIPREDRGRRPPAGAPLPARIAIRLTLPAGSRPGRSQPAEPARVPPVVLIPRRSAGRGWLSSACSRSLDGLLEVGLPPRSVVAGWGARGAGGATGMLDGSLLALLAFLLA